MRIPVVSGPDLMGTVVPFGTRILVGPSDFGGHLGLLLEWDLLGTRA